MKRTILIMMLVLIGAASQGQLMEQREQSQACLDYAESRQKKTEGQLIEQREQSQTCLDYAESRQKKTKSQINPKMQQLFDKLTELGEAPRIVKSGGKNRPDRFDYRVHLYYGPNMYLGIDSISLDSTLCEGRNRMAQQLSIIRHALDELQAEAAESYHYEYHKGGRDTIVYSLNMCHDTTRYASKHHNANHPTFYSDEYLYFNCQPYHDEGEVGATLQYTVHVPNPGPQAEKNSLESLTSDIARLFIQNKIKPRTAMWRHDKTYSDSIHAVDSKDFESRTIIGSNNLEGITHAQIFTVPLEHEEKARQFYDEISRIALRFTEGNLDVLYRYNYLTFDESYWGDILTCYYDETTSCSINMRRNESGFHFVITNTKGMEWFPVDWPSIKSFVNGEVSYFKGMKPKKDNK